MSPIRAQSAPYRFVHAPFYIGRMPGKWTDQQIQDMRARLSDAKRQGLWLSAIEAGFFFHVLTWYQRVSTTGWRRPNEGRIDTVAEMRAQGVTHVVISCEEKSCRRADRKLAIADLTMPGRLPLPDATAFLDIPNVCRFRCVRCGGRRVRMMPVWPSTGGMGGAHGQSSSIPLMPSKPQWSDDA